MKKWITMVILCLLTLCSCQVTPPEPQNQIVLAIQNQCEEDIYGLHCEYSFDGKPYGGQTVSQDTPFPQEETINIIFTPSDISMDVDLSTAQFELYVVLEDKQEMPAGEPVLLAVEYGNTYPFVLSGNEQDGFTLTQAS